MPITVPVPEEYAKKFDAKNPSTYNTHVVFTGPYMVKNDAAGKLDRLQAGQDDRRSCATRTGTRRPTTGPPTWTRSSSDERVGRRRSSARQILDGPDHDHGDFNPPAGDPQAGRDHETRTSSRRSRRGGYALLPAEHEVKPFDNINVRKAVIAGFDRNALRLTRGGEFIGDIADALPPAGHPGLRGGRRLTAAPGLRLPARTRAATWRSPRST